MTAFSKVLSNNQSLHQRILCCENYHFLLKQVQNIMTEKYSAKLFAEKNIDLHHKDMVMTYLSNGILALWRNWFLSGCQIPQDEIIHFSTQLIQHGLDSIG